jgi:hypothetical protein
MSMLADPRVMLFCKTCVVETLPSEALHPGNADVIGTSPPY